MTYSLRIYRSVLLGLICTLVVPPHGMAASMSVDDLKIASIQSEIDRAAEKGDLNNVPGLRMKLADYAVSVQRYEVAARQYELLLSNRPRKAERVKIYTKLGHMRMALKDYSGAIASYDDALHDTPNDWEANLSRARAFSAADINQRAIESYERCIKLRPGEAVSYEELAGVYEDQGFLGKALAYYEKALARDPKPQIYLHMADCYVTQKNIVMATSILAQGKARIPRVEFDVRLGEIYQSLGDLTRASAAWEEAVKADPKRDDVRLRLALLYDQLSRSAESDRLFRALLAAYPQSPLVHYFKALVLFERGERRAAMEESLKVRQLSPTESVAHFNELLLIEIRKPS